ncbi:MAG: CDP-alcohol phosphatidyltransferase family protein [bacterium]
MRDPLKLYFYDRALGAVFEHIIPKWITPNHITIFRFAMTPLVVLFLSLRWYSFAIPFFLFVAFTDVLDGTLARVRGQVTDWGSRYDPLADKLLIGSVLVIILLHYVDPILAFALIALDVIAIIAGAIRTFRGEVVMANRFGKLKMLLQVFGITVLLLGLSLDIQAFVPLSNASFTLALIFSVISLLSYGI